MVASTRRISSVLNLFMHAIRSVSVVPRYLNSDTSSKDLFDVFMLCFCPIFWLRDINVYLFFSGFTCRSTSLLASNKAFVFFFTLSTFDPTILTSSAQTKSWCVPFSFSPTWFY
jgi:hypothetical protein